MLQGCYSGFTCTETQALSWESVSPGESLADVILGAWPTASERSKRIAQHRLQISNLMLRRLLDRELGVVKHDDRMGRPPQRIYVLQRPIRPTI